MQKICWYFWLHYGIQRRSDSSPTAQFCKSAHLTAKQQILPSFCLTTALMDNFLGNWRKMVFGNCKEYWTFFPQAFLYKLDTVIIKIKKLVWKKYCYSATYWKMDISSESTIHAVSQWNELLDGQPSHKTQPNWFWFCLEWQNPNFNW